MTILRRTFARQILSPAEHRLIFRGPETPEPVPEIGALDQPLSVSEHEDKDFLSPERISNRSLRQLQETSQRHYELLEEPQLLRALAKLHAEQQRLVRSLSDPTLAVRNPNFFAYHQQDLVNITHELSAARDVWVDKQGLATMPLAELTGKQRSADAYFKQLHAAYFAKFAALDAKPFNIPQESRAEFENMRTRLYCLTELCVALAVILEERQQKAARSVRNQRQP